MSTAFLQALKAKADTQAPKLSPTPTTTKPVQAQLPNVETPKPETDKLIISIDLVVNRKRIDVFFSHKPNSLILQNLKDQGFSYRPSDRAWYHKDTRENRAWLNDVLGTDIELPEISAPIPETPKNEYHVVAVDNDKPTDSPEYVDPKFATFRKQTDRLMMHFHTADIDFTAADLMLMAIDALYVKTFNYDV